MATAAEYLKIVLASEFKAKAFNDADKAINKLQKSTKKLAGAFGLAYGTTKIVQFGKASLKAFTEDDLAAKSLAKTLDNVGLGFEKIIASKYISDLEMQYAVIDDKLRPAFQRLIVATGDFTKAQSLLETALNVSAGTGKDLDAVTAALSKAYLGNTTALSRLGAGLSKAELAAGDFEKIQARLNTVFAGQAKEAADSYAGSMEKLAIATTNAKEIIGKGLVDALTGAGGDGGLNGALHAIEKSATVVSDLLTGIGRTIGAITAGTKSAFAGKGFISGFSSQSASYRQQDMLARQQYGGIYATKYQKEAAALAKKTAKVQVSAAKTQLAASKQQLKDKKLGYIFDMDQIQVIAALQKTKDEETRKRLELQLALLQGQTEEAQKLASELATIQGANSQLALFLRTLPDAKNPFASWSDYLKAVENQVNALLAKSNQTTSMAAAAIATPAAVSAAMGYAGAGSTAYAERMGYGGAQGIDININLAPGLVADQSQAYTADGGALTISRNNPSWSLGTN